MAITWNKQLELGIASIDTEHQQLLALMDQIVVMVDRGNVQEAALVKIMDELLNFTIRHFAHEEREFLKTGYSDRRNHEKLHRELMAQVSAFKLRLATGQAIIYKDLAVFLNDWLVSHILSVDKNYVEHFSAKGVR
jgi:hemerythrin-like metal-binding protein